MNIVVLAAGLGKRMASPLPKLLHPLGGKALLAHVLDAVRACAPDRLIVVIGHGGERIRECIDAHDVIWVRQAPLLGTGHALMQALPALGADPVTLVVTGDVPLVRTATLMRLAAAAGPARLAILSATVDDATGYGRIVRNARGDVTGIVEDKDASPAERQIREINTGILALPTAHLASWLARLNQRNAQGEYYLTDLVAMAVSDGVPVATEHPQAFEETLGVNSQAQLAALERLYQRERAREQMHAGVMLADANRFDVRGELTCGSQVAIDVGCVFEGVNRLGHDVRIGPYCVIKNSVIEDGAVIEAFCHLDTVTVGPSARVGPYARLRPGTQLQAEVHIGNFVEVKNSQIGRGSKANHLSYLGDATIGQRVNVGAGTITCNYDGANKHRTEIGDDVHIGSDVQLVAPVSVGRGATLGAGTTVWKDVAAETLVVNPKSQKASLGWSRPKKKS